MTPATNQRRVLTVTSLTRQIKELLESKFTTVSVSGEISDVTQPRSGHIYFTLKDKQAQIRAVVWRTQAVKLPFDVKNGQQVVCRGNLDVYPPRGSYQLAVKSMEPVGVGDVQQRLRELYRKLKQQGCFDPARKKTLPAFAEHLVLVTSPTGAAVRDFLEVARRRWQKIRITIVPVRVQGENAGMEIAHAVRKLERLRPAPDLMVVTRGGGSVDDLWCFNDEALVRAIHDASIPVISAVGHEVDVTLCDLAADVRALTPSEAAELAVPSAADVRQQITHLRQRLEGALRKKASDARRRIEQLRQRRVMLDPLNGIRQRQRVLDELQQRAAHAVARHVRHTRRQLSTAAAHLESLSPLGVLARGYAVATDESGELVSDVAQLQIEQRLDLRFRDGAASVRVERLRGELSQTAEAPAANAFDERNGNEANDE